MSSLTSTQINLTYPGLLKLADSTTGITSTLQSVEDGLGNDTGLIIGTDYLGGASVVSSVQLTGLKNGTGFTGGNGLAFNGGSHDRLQSLLFYDRGFVSYSSITFGVGTISTTQDTIEFGIYDAQVAGIAGYQPKSLISDIIIISSADTSSTGLKTFTFSANTNFEKGGYYFLCFVVTNPGLQPPTCRFRGPIQPAVQSSIAVLLLGTVLNSADDGFVNCFRAGSSSQIGQLYGGINGVLLTSYDEATLLAGISSTAQSLFGFVLNPVI